MNDSLFELVLAVFLKVQAVTLGVMLLGWAGVIVPLGRLRCAQG